MEKHTPGPWYSRNGSSPHFQGQVASESTGDTIAISYSDEDGANARLIAAAPELLAVLVQAVHSSGFSLSGPSDSRAAEDGEPAWVCNARAAIAKATS
jgi:hypothetical protein